MNSRSLRVNKRTLLWALLFVVLLRPSGLVYVLGISAVSRAMSWGASLLVLYLTIKGVTHCSRTNRIYIYYMLYLLTITIIVGGVRDDIVECLNMVIGNVAMVLFVSYICHKDTDIAIQAMSSVYAILLTMNLIAMCLYPHGMYNMDQWEIYHR